MKKLFVTTVLMMAASLAFAGDLKVAHVFSDHAVMQRETSVPVWGWGTPGAKVSVTSSWDGKTVSTSVSSDGAWRVKVTTAQAGGSHTITVKSGKETVEVKDIAFGEVWLCSGQSNMEMPMQGYGFQEIEGFRNHLMESHEFASRVRVFNIKADTTHVAQLDVETVWEYTEPNAFCNTSAVGYMFAKRLAQNLDVPVGIISNAWGGSRIEPWMSQEAIEGAGLTDDELTFVKSLKEHANRWPNSIATCWNGRMLPVAGYPVKGFIWYQGCSNIGQACYDKLQTAMVKLWRETWGCGDVPFIFALLAPYEHGDVDGRWRPQFVRTQMNALKTTPNSYAVCTETIGKKETVHPPFKQEVADMMAMRAFSCAYGQQSGITLDYPEPESVDYLEDGRVRIKFTNVWSNLMSICARNIRGFELAGEDRVFHLADAYVDWDGETVYVKCDSVTKPVAVRYSFRNWMDPNLQTSYGIPVPPFRTDDWNL